MLAAKPIAIAALIEACCAAKVFDEGGNVGNDDGNDDGTDDGGDEDDDDGEPDGGDGDTDGGGDEKDGSGVGASDWDGDAVRGATN